jgi:hypothetical protein
LTFIRAGVALAALLAAQAALCAMPALARPAPALPAPVPPTASGSVRIRGAIIGSTPARVPVPIVLPRALPITDAASSTLFSAMLAIARARQIDPQAAQTASFQYTQAVQQYRSGNVRGARLSALQALSTADSAQVRPVAPAPISSAAAGAAPVQVPGLAGGLYGADAPVVDAAAFLALARGIIDDCAARRDRRLADAQQHYARAQQDFSQHNWQATRIDAKATIDACAKPQP